MKELVVDVPSKSSGYHISIGADLLTRLGELIQLDSFSQLIVLTDSTVATLHLSRLLEFLPGEPAVIEIAAGDGHKNSQSLAYVWKQLHQFAADRNTLLLNLGGGVIADLGGLAASTYMRGISFVQLPTTLLAQVDASVGGKTAIDFAGVKNLVGSFAVPHAVVADVSALKTLPARELRAGMAEAVKHGIIADPEYLSFVASFDCLGAELSDWMLLVERSCQIKARIVAADPYDTAVRKSLNFGHTLGHAIEAVLLETASPLLHGEAVSIGIVGALWLSVHTCDLPAGFLSRIEGVLTELRLPIRLKCSKENRLSVLERLTRDKKSVAGEMRWVLLAEPACVVHDQLVSDSLVENAVDYLVS